MHDEMSGSAVIKSIKGRADSSFCISIEVGNESGCECIEYIILEELLDGLDVRLGDIEYDVLDTLEKHADITAAYMSACSSFAYTQSSLKALYRKLVIKGFSKDVSAEAIEIVRAHGFVDENDIAVRRAEIMLSKLWGRSRILQKLRDEGFSGKVISHADTFLEGVDFVGNCVRLIQKKYSIPICDRRERDKMYASLLRMGYSSYEIKEAIDLISEQ